MISLHSLYHLRFPDGLRNILIGALLTVILVPAFASFAVSEDNGLAEVRATYDQLHSKLIESQGEKPIDNVQGSIVWGSSYQLDSYVSMYQATGDTVYLDHFLRLADRVLAARADKSGELDFRGRLTFGWLSGGHYTYGKPVVLKDSDGNPSVQIQTIGNSYNDKVSIEIIAGATAASFTVKCIDHRNPDQPKETLLRDLTMETAVREVNPKEGEPRLIQLKRIGDRPPAPIGPFIPETQLMTFHGHHTGRILTPMARFCDLVINNDDLEKYREKAEDYLLEIRISMAEHDQFLVEEDDWGYTIFERGSPFWCDGVPEPHNTMACSGSTYIHLYRATGEPYFLDRATRLARMFKRNHIPQADGTWLFHYWWGPMETGWNEGEGTSDHLGSYAGQSVPEDISHLQLTLMFLADCYENGIVFGEEDLDRWAKTFNTVLYHEDDEGPYLPFRVDGSQSGKSRGSSNHVLYGFLEIGACVDSTMVDRCQSILEANYSHTASPTVLFSYAALAKASRTP
ncbi:MAG: hypothetical protein H6752_15060 [Candidatus Omnitrophica bacterium]|nr:hypothetical protein [Candidatus Omnitrophota bacterium]